MAESDPTRDLLTAARKLAACPHLMATTLDNVEQGPNAEPSIRIRLCLNCGSHRYLRGGDADLAGAEPGTEPGGWLRPGFVGDVTRALGRIAAWIASMPVAAGVVRTWLDNEPMREGARALYACPHANTLYFDDPTRKTAAGPPAVVVHCIDCGSRLADEGEGWMPPRMVEVLVDAAREADMFAANVAHAEAHDREVAEEHAANVAHAKDQLDQIERAVPSRARTLLVDRARERLANLLAQAPLHREQDCPCHACDCRCHEEGEAPGAPGRAFDAPPIGAATSSALLRTGLDVAAARLHAMTELVRALDQVDPRTFAVHGVDIGLSLDEVRTTARTRMRGAAKAYVEASDELYAIAERDGAGP